MGEKSEFTCSEGATFFGKSVTAQDGSKWLWNETNGLFVPLAHAESKTPMFEEMRWECLEGLDDSNVRGRSSSNLSDVSEAEVKMGQTISALPVPEHPGWLMESESKLFYPMNHPNTGAALFRMVRSKPKTSASGSSMDVEQGQGSQTLKLEDDATCQQVATCLSCFCPIVGCVTFCISTANHKQGSRKRKWGNIACAVGTCSFLATIVLQMYGL